MRSLLLSTFFGLLLLAPGLALAQVGTISGRVTEADTGEPVPGVNVVLLGTNFGTASDVQGNFSFTAPAGQHTLIATFVGFERFTLPVTVQSGQTTNVSVRLVTSRVGLDEVVVTALGLERAQRSLGYATQSVGGDAVSEAAAPNIVNALAGKVAGVNITSSSGQPGKAARITIRGNASLLGNNQPLFVIDGVPISNDEDDNLAANTVFTGGTSNRAVDLDPNIIEDITVLKGASATALYGSRASNGAVIITTKRGAASQAGRPRFSYTSRVTADENLIEGFQTQYLQGNNGYFLNGLPLARGGYVQPGAKTLTGQTITNPQTTLSWGPRKDQVSQAVIDSIGPIQTFDPRAEFYQTGLATENSLNISGGGALGNYFLAGTALRQQGTVPGTRLDRTSVMAKFSSQLNPKLNLATSVNYINTSNAWLYEGNGQVSFFYNLNSAPISFNIKEYRYEDGSQRQWATGFNNPLWVTQNQALRSNVDRFISNVTGRYLILPWLMVNGTLGLDTYTDNRKEEVNVGTVGRVTGSMFDQTSRRSEINSDFTLQVERPLTSSIGMNAVVGHNLNRRGFQYNFLRGLQLSIPEYYNIQNAASITGQEYREERMLVGVYSTLTLDYQDYLYLNLTARNDWSSTLPADNNSYFYPSASLAFVFTDALNFGGNILNYGQVRASVAQVGSDAPVYSLSTTYLQSAPSDGQRGVINFPLNGINGFSVSNTLGNPDLAPEISTEYEIGTDLRFLDQRLRLDAAYYNRTTNGQIFAVPVSAATGFTSRLANAGTIRNSGVEVAAGVTFMQTRDFRFDVQANYSKNTTDVVELAEGVENIFLAGFTNPQIRIQKGKDGYGVIWGTRYSRNDAGQLLIDDDGYPILASDLGAIGNVQPDWLANFRPTLSFRGASVSALFDVRRGGDVLNFDKFYTIFYGTAKETENRGTEIVWEGVNATTGQPNTKAVMQDQAYYQTFYTNAYENLVEDGSFVKLREVSLSYSVSPRLIQRYGVQSLSLTAVGRNLLILSDFTYGDPEGSLTGGLNGQGFYHGVTPSTRSYSLSLQIGF